MFGSCPTNYDFINYYVFIILIPLASFWWFNYLLRMGEILFILIIFFLFMNLYILNYHLKIPNLY